MATAALLLFALVYSDAVIGTQLEATAGRSRKTLSPNEALPAMPGEGSLRAVGTRPGDVVVVGVLGVEDKVLYAC